MSLTDRLTELVAAGFREAGHDPQWATVVPSARPDLGQFQTNGALAAAKAAGANPRELAGAVAAALERQNAFGAVSIAGPGFINLTLADEYLTAHIATGLEGGRVGVAPAAEPTKAIIDYGGPNVAKPMHVGHLRAAIIGESVKRIARFLGHDVLGDVHLGDWGLQMGMLIAEMQRRQPDLPYFDETNTGPFPTEAPVTMADLDEMYRAANRAAKEDPDAMAEARSATFALQQGRPGYRALWQHFHDVSIRELQADYATLGVTFDLWLGESDTQAAIPPMIDRLRREGLAVESQGALVVDVSEPDDKKEVPPLMLLKTDGAVLYGTTDLATIDERVRRFDVQSIVYVVDKRQSEHFRQVFRAARKTGIAPPSVKLEHAAFGTMNGKDGKPFKTREGGAMRLNELLQLVTTKATERLTELGVAEDYPASERAAVAHTVGMATLKYADLMNHRGKDYVFDLERFSSFEGRTGPYLLYATVRAKSILRKAADEGMRPGTLLPPASEAERDVLLELAKFPDVVRRAWAGRAPNHLCDYGYQLATAFNRFYHEHHILSERDLPRRDSWLALSTGCVEALRITLDLLGIGVPDRM